MYDFARPTPRGRLRDPGLRGRHGGRGGRTLFPAARVDDGRRTASTIRSARQSSCGHRNDSASSGGTAQCRRRPRSPAPEAIASFACPVTVSTESPAKSVPGDVPDTRRGKRAHRASNECATGSATRARRHRAATGAARSGKQRLWTVSLPEWHVLTSDSDELLDSDARTPATATATTQIRAHRAAAANLGTTSSRPRVGVSATSNTSETTASSIAGDSGAVGGSIYDWRTLDPTPDSCSPTASRPARVPDCASWSGRASLGRSRTLHRTAGFGE